jgi:hypothetical protein
MSKHNDIYNILGKLEALQPKEQPTKAEDKKAIYESVAARGSVLEGVGKVERQLTEKFAGFDVSESGLQAYLGKKKYGEQGMKALQKAGRNGASKEKMAMIRAKHDKMDEAVGQEGPADLLAAVEQEIARPGRSIDNLLDVMNATFGSDRSPEFKKARAVIGKYIDLVNNAAMGSEQDGIAPMRGGNIARHIQQYDLTDYLQHAAAMLDNAVKGPMHDKMDESNPTDPNTWQGPDAGGAFPGQKVWPKGKRPGMYNTQTGKVSHWDNRTDTEREKSWDSMIEGGKPHPKELEMDAKVRSMGIQQRADKAEKNLAAKRAEPKTVGQKIAKDIGGPLKKLAKGDIRGALSEEPNEEMLSTKDKKFASLAEPKDKITYADKIAGAKKKTEGNKFTGNLMKARAQGKKEADLDGDGDMEKVREGWDDMMKAAKERSGPQPSGGSGIKAGRRYGGAAQKDDEGDAEPAADNAPKKKGRPKKDKFAEVAPPGAKAERMVKHIKKGYAKDGKVTPKEKGIAYATAWKAHNKGKVEEQGMAEGYQLDEGAPTKAALRKATK